MAMSQPALERGAEKAGRPPMQWSPEPSTRIYSVSNSNKGRCKETDKITICIDNKNGKLFCSQKAMEVDCRTWLNMPLRTCLFSINSDTH